MRRDTGGLAGIDSLSDGPLMRIDRVGLPYLDSVFGRFGPFGAGIVNEDYPNIKSLPTEIRTGVKNTPRNKVTF